MRDALRTTKQLIVIARLGEFCTWNDIVRRHAGEPWTWMRGKLTQADDALAELKGELLSACAKSVIKDIESGQADETRCADYRFLFDALLRRGDFADLAIHLEPRLAKASLPLIRQVLARVEPAPSSDTDRLGPLMLQLKDRLQIGLLDQVMMRKPRTPRRRALVLHRLRLNVREYCTVMRMPLDASDTFTPFMLPRVEALIASCLRFLNRYR